MKLRMAENSVRVRLGRSEVAQLASTGLVEAEVQFSTESRFTYRLVSGAQIAAPHVSFSNGLLEVWLSENDIHEWSSNDQVAITGLQGTLDILIEKDFQCLHQEDQRDRDTYPNPAA